jgi:hypothetical protein
MQHFCLKTSRVEAIQETVMNFTEVGCEGMQWFQLVKLGVKGEQLVINTKKTVGFQMNSHLSEQNSNSEIFKEFV